MARFWILLAMALVVGCLIGGKNGNKQGTGLEADTDTDTDTDTDADFELMGTWEYSGGFSGLTNTLTITADQMLDTGDYNGTDWIITFTIHSWDNKADQALLEVAEVEGYSHYDVGDSLWRLEEDTLTLYISTTEYVTPSGGTEGTTFVTYTRSD